MPRRPQRLLAGVGLMAVVRFSLILQCVRDSFDTARWSATVCQLVQFTALWPASWVSALDKFRVSKSSEVEEIWRICDDQLQFVQACDAATIGWALEVGDVHGAWEAWSAAAERALTSAQVLAGGPAPSGGLVQGGRSARFGFVVLGGARVCRFRADVTDPSSATEVHMFRDCPVAPLPHCWFASVGSRLSLTLFGVLVEAGLPCLEVWTLVCSWRVF